VDHAFAVCVLHGAADFAEELDSVGDLELVLIAEAVDRPADDALHDDEGVAP
jgi:hypothetical protein